MTYLLSVRRLLGLLSLSAALLAARPALAQVTVPPDDDPASPGPTKGGGATGVPIDGGASLLLAGGVAYGLRKLRQRRAR